MPYRKLFRSRWAALLWAIGILWTAADTVGFAPAKTATTNELSAANATDAPLDDPNLAILANVMKGD